MEFKCVVMNITLANLHLYQITINNLNFNLYFNYYLTYGVYRLKV